MAQTSQRSRFWLSMFFAVALFLCLAGSVQAAKNHLVVGFEDTVGTMNYYQTTARVDIQTAMMIYDPLLERDPKDGSLHPHLVAEWKIINDTTWEFKLRPGVKFHNGNPLNAECIRFTIEDRILDPKQKSPLLTNWKWIKKVEVIDDLTFRLITDGPYPVVLQRLNFLFPIDPRWTKEMIAKNGEEYLSNNAMGTGPFKFVRFVKGEKIELVRNEQYWKKGFPKFEKMTIRFIPEMSTRLAELIAGGVDIAHAILPDQIPTLEKSKNVKVVEVPILRFFFWAFDGDGRAGERSAPLKDVRVRRAIYHAIDREAIIKNVVNHHADLCNIPMNPLQFGADTSIKGLEYNPEKAKALLKEAGYEKGFTLSLWPILALYKQVDEAAAGYLDKVGIKVEIKDYVGRWPEAAKLLTTGKVDGALTTSWGMFSIYDPDAFWPFFFLTPEGPYVFNTDPELMDWIRQSRQTLDQEKRKGLYKKAQQRIIDRVYMMPWFTERAIHGASKHFSYVLGSDEIPRYQYGQFID
jgi:peptide/nickel transport system substrate-binding protein